MHDQLQFKLISFRCDLYLVQERIQMDSNERSLNQNQSGSRPLRNYRHERFAQARAILTPLLEAARESGYEQMTPGNAAKIDRNPKVRDRIKFLAGNTEEVIRRKRERLERELETVALSNMDDFLTIDDRGYPVLDLKRLKELPDIERRELLAAVKTVRYTDNGPTFELHPKLDAVAQLRKINGLDVPEKLTLTNPQGTGVMRVEFVRAQDGRMVR
jgi:hypothetical protein